MKNDASLVRSICVRTGLPYGDVREALRDGRTPEELLLWRPSDVWETDMKPPPLVLPRGLRLRRTREMREEET